MLAKKQTIYLFLAGTTLSLVGAFIAIWPSDYLLQFNVNNPGNDFQSEIRGMGGGLLIFGLYLLAAVAQQKLRHTALTIASLIFSAFVIFRVTGVLIDGLPGQGIIIALLLEIVFAAGAFILLQTSQKEITS